MINEAEINATTIGAAYSTVRSGATYPFLLWQASPAPPLPPTPPPGAIPISTIGELQLIGNDPAYPLSGDYYLTGDIDASATVGWNDGAGFEPIGTFTGTFNGMDYAITGLHIDRDATTYVGLFGRASGTICNLAVLGADVTGYERTGVIVGRLDAAGVVQDCHTSGTVHGAYRSQGGVVGRGSGAVTRCSNAASVSGADLYTGGVVGRATGNATFTQCSNTGAVTGTQFVSGVVGLVAGDATFTQCSNTGAVTGAGYVGGVVGVVASASTGVAFTDCYSVAATVTGSSNRTGGFCGWDNWGSTKYHRCYAVADLSGASATSRGGFTGHLATGTMDQQHCYWHETSGVVTTTACGATRVVAEADMKVEATFVGFDFATVWGIGEGTGVPGEPEPAYTQPDVVSTFTTTTLWFSAPEIEV